MQSGTLLKAVNLAPWHAAAVKPSQPRCPAMLLLSYQVAARAANIFVVQYTPHLEPQVVWPPIWPWHFDELICAAYGRDELRDEGLQARGQLHRGWPVLANVLKEVLQEQQQQQRPQYEQWKRTTA
jgi:hypothetical protein